MSTAAPTFTGADADMVGSIAAPPPTPSARRAIFGTVLVVSLLAHGATALFLLAVDSLDGESVTTTLEIPVDIVTEAPKAKGAASGAGKADGGTPGAAGGGSNGAAKGASSSKDAKSEAPKPEAAPGGAPKAASSTPEPGHAAPAPAGSTAQPKSEPAPKPDVKSDAKPGPKPEPASKGGEPEAHATAAAGAPPQPQPQPVRSPSPQAQPVRPAPPPPPPSPPTPLARAALPGPATAFGPLPGTFNAVVLPSATIGGQEAVSYRALVFSQIAKAKHFPEAARARGASGVAVVSFSIDDSGAPLGVTLARSSGDPDIDAEIVAMVSRAAPFPPPPQGAQRNFSAAIEFGHDE